MTVISELAKRYASALVQTTQGKGPDVLNQLRIVEAALESDPVVAKFIVSELISGDEKRRVLEIALSKLPLLDEVKGLAYVMAENQRLGEWPSVVLAYEKSTDEENGIVRGVVRSTSPLGPEQRQVLEKKITQVTGKRVILEFNVDPDVLGGLVAEVGSLRFDDSLQTQLRLLNEELKKKAH